jgi:hypothetical protein
MRHIRFAGAVAVLGALAVAGLAGCRSNPTVAAYVGDHTYSTERVERIYDEVRNPGSPAPDGTPSPSPTAPAPAASRVSRQQVLTVLVGLDLAKSAAEAKGLKPEPISAALVGQQFGIPADSEYAKLYAEYRSYVEALVAEKKSTTPTDADLQIVLDRLVQAGLAEPMSLEQARTQLGENNLAVVARYSEVRDELAAQAGKSNVVVNPRYAPAEVGVLELTGQQGQRYPLIVVPLEQV